MGVSNESSHLSKKSIKDDSIQMNMSLNPLKDWRYKGQLELRMRRRGDRSLIGFQVTSSLGVRIHRPSTMIRLTVHEKETNWLKYLQSIFSSSISTMVSDLSPTLPLILALECAYFD